MEASIFLIRNAFLFYKDNIINYKNTPMLFHLKCPKSSLTDLTKITEIRNISIKCSVRDFHYSFEDLEKHLFTLIYDPSNPSFFYHAETILEHLSAVLIHISFSNKQLRIIDVEAENTQEWLESNLRSLPTIDESSVLYDCVNNIKELSRFLLRKNNFFELPDNEDLIFKYWVFSCRHAIFLNKKDIASRIEECITFAAKKFENSYNTVISTLGFKINENIDSPMLAKIKMLLTYTCKDWFADSQIDQIPVGLYISVVFIILHKRPFRFQYDMPNIPAVIFDDDNSILCPALIISS